LQAFENKVAPSSE